MRERRTLALAVLLLVLAAPGAVTADDDAEPTEFTAIWKFSGAGGTGDTAIVDGVYQDRARIWHLVAVADGLFSDDEHLVPWSWKLHGVIFEGVMPPAPDAAD